MKKVILPLLLCLLFAANAAAQAEPPRGGRDRHPPSADERTERLTKQLTLDEKQAARVLEIFTAADVEREALHKQYEEQLHADACAHFNKLNGQIKSLLTAQQSVEFDELTARMQARRQDHRGRRAKEHTPPIDCGDSSS